MLKILIYLLLFVLNVSVYWLILPKKWRSLYLFGFSVLFISLFSIKYTVYFLFNTSFVYAGSRIIHQGNVHKKRIFKLLLIWIIGNLCYFKYIHLLNTVFNKLSIYLSFLPRVEFPVLLLPLGVSYIMFRLIHYIVEVYRKKSPVSSFVDFASYVLFFPTYISGPVERFPAFHAQTTAQKDFDVSDFNYGLQRIFLGILRKFIIADNLKGIIMPVLLSPEKYNSLTVVLAIYGLAVQIYMDFAGYTDLAIGVARLFGYKIMENFNSPYLKKNIALFWRNWHISVYSFIRDYFFFPLFGYKATTLKIYMGIFSSMIVFMLWHEGSLNFLVLGIYHGFGLIFWHLFQELKRKYVFLRMKKEIFPLTALSIFLTFSFVSFGFIFFSFDFNQIKIILSAIF